MNAASILAGFEGADGTGSKQLRDFCEVRCCLLTAP